MEIGGQALIEGILIKSPKRFVVAIRKEGKIKIKTEPLSKYSKKFSKFPLIRGVVVLIETLYIGMISLLYSVKEQEEEGEEITNTSLAITLLISALIAIGLFVFLPLAISKALTENRLLFNIIDGVIRIGIFLGYLAFISKNKEIQRIFKYHGAEHMSVHCYEAKEKLTIENCRKFSTCHPRCGTSFIFIVLIISILVFSIIWHPSFIVKFIQRILLIPVVAAVSYEFLKLTAKKQKNTLLQAVARPGMWIQKITTKTPDDDQLEVAIAAVKKAIS